MSIKSFRTLTSVLIGGAAMLCATAAAAQATPDAGPKETGFAVQTSVIMGAALVDPQIAALGLTNVEGGMTFGYKFSRGMIGVGFDFTNFGVTRTTETFDPTTGTPTGTREVTENEYSFVVYPQFQIAMARSADRRAELIGDISLGIGTWGTRNSEDPTPNDDDSRIRVRWRFGPGVRYWVHPQIGLSLTTGVSGNHMLFSGATSAQDTSVGLTSLFGQFGLLGVF